MRKNFCDYCKTELPEDFKKNGMIHIEFSMGVKLTEYFTRDVCERCMKEKVKLIEREL